MVGSGFHFSRARRNNALVIKVEGEKLIRKFFPPRRIFVTQFQMYIAIFGISKVLLALSLNIELFRSKNSTISYFNGVEKLHSKA